MKNRLLLSLGLIALASGSYLRAGFDSDLEGFDKKYEDLERIVGLAKSHRKFSSVFGALAVANKLLKELEELKTRYFIEFNKPEEALNIKEEAIKAKIEELKTLNDEVLAEQRYR